MRARITVSRSGLPQTKDGRLIHPKAPQLGWGPISDQKTIGVINTILDSESPDLAVLNGDLITGENTYLENSTHYLDEIVGPIAKRNIHFATVYGNHDINYNLSTEALFQREKALWPSLSHTLDSVHGNASGVSNYYVPIWPSRQGYGQNAPAMLLWMFDSKGGKAFRQLDANGNQIQLPGTVDQSVTDWFTTNRDRINQKYGRTIPSLAFVHIPTYASGAAQQTGNGINNRTAPGINDDCCPAATQDNDSDGVNFMNALLGTAGLIAVFSGHDHGNDWCYKWNSKLAGMTITGNGLDICFGRHTGYGGYGSWTRGSRQIRVSEKLVSQGIADTWVRLENENISGYVTLNSTYGTDKYPVVADTFT